MRSLALSIIFTVQLGISAIAATVPNRYVTNTDDVAITFNRLKLTNSLTYFVATTGSDVNAGTNASFPLLTIQAAVDKALTWDFSTNNITVQIADGSYSGSILVQGQFAQTDWKDTKGMLILHGNDASPSSVIITNASTNHLVLSSQHSKLSVTSLTLGSTNIPNADLLCAQLYSTINVSNIIMGPCGTGSEQVTSEEGGMFYMTGPYTITGGGLAHWVAQSGGSIWLTSTITITGTPVYTLAFVQAYGGAIMVAGGSISGSANGVRYQLTRGGSITTFGSGSVDSIFPGSLPGIQDLQMGEGSTRPFTATNGVFGATNASVATAGVVGEYTNRIVTFASATNVISTVATNITSITLSPGDWDVSGAVSFTYTSATVTESKAAITTISSTIPVDGTAILSGDFFTTSSTSDTLTIPTFRINTSIATNVLLVGQANFSAGTAVGYGQIQARRVR